MAVVGRIKLKVHLNDEEKVSEVFVSPTTKCRDIVLRLQRQIRQQDCCLVEVWQGCERLVPEDELIQSTLLDWAMDLEDVTFYLRPNEDIITLVPQSPVTDDEIPMLEDIEATYDFQGSLSRNGIHENTNSSYSDETSLGSGQLSLEQLKQIILRQQQEISSKEQELRAKEEQLREVKQRAQSKIQSSYIHQLIAKVQEQDESMQQLRQIMTDTEEIRIINDALEDELDLIESQFVGKEQELAMAVAKVDSMTQQLEEQRQVWRQATTQDKQTANQQRDMEMLRQELMMRNELNHQQNVQLQMQKKLLANKHKDLSGLDSHVEKLTEELRYKKARGYVNHVDMNNHDELLDLDDPWDYSDKYNIDDQDIADINEDSIIVATHPQINALHHVSRALETLMEEEEPSIGNGSKLNPVDGNRPRTTAVVSSPDERPWVTKMATFFDVAAKDHESALGNGEVVTNKSTELLYANGRIPDNQRNVISPGRQDSSGICKVDGVRAGVNQTERNPMDGRTKPSSPLSSPSSLSSLSSISSSSSLTHSSAFSFSPERKQNETRAPERLVKRTLPNERPRMDAHKATRPFQQVSLGRDLGSSAEIRDFQPSFQNLKSAAISLSDASRSSDLMNTTSTCTSSSSTPETITRIASVDPKELTNNLNRHTGTSSTSSTNSNSANSSISSSPKVYKSTATFSLGRIAKKDEDQVKKFACASPKDLDSPKSKRNNKNRTDDDSASDSSSSSYSGFSGPVASRSTMEGLPSYKGVASSGNQCIPPPVAPSVRSDTQRAENENRTKSSIGNSNSLNYQAAEGQAPSTSRDELTYTPGVTKKPVLAVRIDSSPGTSLKDLSNASKQLGASVIISSNGSIRPGASVSSSNADEKPRTSVIDSSNGGIQSRTSAEQQRRKQEEHEKKKTRRVILDPHAVLLDAALEGELEQVRLVIKDVEDPSLANSDGITALHNSVCGNHFCVVKFLVEYGCDINLPDSHGWTPLHCSAVNNNLDVVRYLMHHGACIFAATSLEKKTPAECCDKNAAGYYECSQYLQEIQRDFGLLNGGRVFALYAYVASEQDELCFECGEELTVLRRGDTTEKEWWWAENSAGEAGYIPRNLLGMYPRVAPEV